MIEFYFAFSNPPEVAEFWPLNQEPLVFSHHWRVCALLGAQE